MSQAYLGLLALFLALQTTTLSASRLQFSLPRDDLLPEPFQGDDLLPEPFQDDLSKEAVGESVLDSPESAERLRTAQRALLDLNDGELRSLLKGVPVEKIKETLSPSMEFFLEASRSRLNHLKSLLSEKKAQRLEGDLRIARRNKKRFQPFLSRVLEGNIEERNFEASADADTDSLLGALTELSESIGKEKRRARKSQKKHKRHSFHSSSKAHNIHYSYWLKPEECPNSPKGMPRVHCPSPTDDGDWLCVEDQDLCDNRSQCPGHEDEEPKACLFFKSMQNYVDLLVSALLVSLRS